MTDGYTRINQKNVKSINEKTPKGIMLISIFILTPILFLSFFQKLYPMSALYPTDSIPETAAISSLSDVSPEIPRDPTMLLFLSLINTPPGTGTKAPFVRAFTEFIK